MRVCDFHHWQPWNACAHNMKHINHDLKEKWILDSGATNHMTGNPELLDGATCPVPSIYVYLGNNEKLMATRIGSFKSPKISIPVLVVPGLNVNLISCAQLCADLQCWIVLNGTGGYIYDKGGNKLCSLQTLGNLFILELRLQSKSRCLVTLFSKGNINTWHRRLGHASLETLRKLENLDSMEILMTATFALKENWNTSSSQEGNPTLNNF